MTMMTKTNPATMSIHSRTFPNIVDADAYRAKRVPGSTDITERMEVPSDGWMRMDDRHLVDGEYMFIVHRGIMAGVELRWRGVAPAPFVGDVVTVTIWTDRYTADITAVSPSGKTITCRRRNATCKRGPEMAPGGFAGVVTRNADWVTESDPDGHVFKATLRKTGKWKVAGTPVRSAGNNVAIDVDAHYHDYEF